MTNTIPTTAEQVALATAAHARIGGTVTIAGRVYSVSRHHFTGPNADALLERLASLVPVLQDPTSGGRFRVAIKKSIDDAMKSGPTVTEKL